MMASGNSGSTTPPLATVADHNAAFDPADEALGGAFRAGFREGWIHGQSPDGTDYGDLAERYPQAVDIEPSEAWQAHRDGFFAMLPLAAIPAVGSPLPQSVKRLAVEIEAARLVWLQIAQDGGATFKGVAITASEAETVAGALDWVVSRMVPLIAGSGR